MKTKLLTLVWLVSQGSIAGAAPTVTLGPPVSNSFATVDPGSIQIAMLGAGDVVDLQVSITIDVHCVLPIDIVLATTGDDGTFSTQTGVLNNGCGGDTSEFDIRITGDGLPHDFDIQFLDNNNGTRLASISVQLLAGNAPVVTLGPPLAGDFVTVDPRSIRVEMLGAGSFVNLQVSITVHPFCVAPIDLGLGATGDGGTFLNLTGALVNQCGGDTSEFDIRLTGDGVARAYDIEFLDLNGGSPLFSIPVDLFPGVADTDGDGISDLTDNCLLVANTNQRDTNLDRIGNLCDPDVALPNDCTVNFLDLNVYKANFFRVGDLDTDNNGDGQTNFIDLEVVKSFFFQQPGPSAIGCN